MKRISENWFRFIMLCILSFGTGLSIAVANNVIQIGYPNSFLKIDEFCDNCIYSRHIADVDDEDIENDTNTYVDIAGDDMTGPLYTPNITAINGTFENITTIDLYVDNIFGGSDFDIWDNYNMNWNNISNTNLNNTIINNGTATNFNMTNFTGFSNPKFDSGWINFNAGDKKLITHNTGGNASNYFPLVLANSATYGINMINFGSRQLAYGTAGYRWELLNSTHIQLWRFPQDVSAEQMRVFLWEWDYSPPGTEVLTLETNANDTDVFPRSGVYANMTVDENINVTKNATIGGVIRGLSPLRLEEALEFVDPTGKPIYLIYRADNSSTDFSDIPTYWNNSLVIQTEEIINQYAMHVCFYDEANTTMLMCVNQGAPGKATTVRRSFQIVGNKTVKEEDGNFTTCEGANFVDCSTDTTGADLYIQDDIEAQSIFANENLTVTGNISVNQIYGEVWNYTGAGYTFAIATTGVYYNLTGCINGDMNGFNSTDNFCNMTAQVSGKYKVDFSLSFGDGPNNDFGVGVAKNGDIERKCYTRRKIGASGDVGNTGGSCFIDLNVGDFIGMQVEDETNPTANIDVYATNLNAVRIGDTS